MVLGIVIRLRWSEPWISLWYGVSVVGVTLGCTVLGLPLAKRYGLIGGLLPVGAGFVLWEVMLDLTYCIWKTPSARVRHNSAADAQAGGEALTGGATPSFALYSTTE